MPTLSMMNKSPQSQAIRPYNAYNIFFQLERNRILQLEHQYLDPALDSPALTFDATDPTSGYTGPPRLPSRYSEVILPIDWHLPNKNKKRKRLHRKSHGRIGFHALNQQISRAWGNIEEEVRVFCSNLAESEAAKHRKMTRPREDEELSTNSSCNTKPTMTNLDNSCTSSSLPPLPSFTRYRSVSSESSTSAGPVLSVLISNTFYFDPCLQSSSHVGLPQRSSSLRSRTGVVDMDDEEIMSLWESSDAADDKETRAVQENFHLLSHFDPVNIPSSGVQSLQRVDEEAGKMSLRLDRSLHKFSNYPKRKSFAARQA